MPKLIQDEFTNRTDLSAPRKYQLRRERDGLCRICGKPGKSGLCPTHRAYHRRFVRIAHNPQSII